MRFWFNGLNRLGSFIRVRGGSLNDWRHSIFGDSAGYNHRRVSDRTIAQAYTGNDTAYSVIRYLAVNGANLPFVHYKGDTELEVDSKDPYYLLMSRPDKRTSEMQFWYQAITQFALTGDLFLHKSEQSLGFSDSKGFRILESAYVTSEYAKGSPSPMDEPIRYVYEYGDIRRTYEPEEIVHIKLYDPMPEGEQCNRGLSPFQPGSWVLEAHNNSTVAESSILKNRGASKLISAKDWQTPLKDTQVSELNEGLKTEMGGAKRFGGLHHLRTPVDIHDLGLSPSDLKLIEMYPNHLRRICTMFNLPAELFNVQGAGQFNTRKEARKAAFSESIIPLVNFILEALVRANREWGFDTRYNSEVNLDLVQALHPDQEELYTMYLNWYKEGAISRQKFLELIGHEDTGTDFKASGQTQQAPEGAESGEA